MTKAELIKALEPFDDDMEVVYLRFDHRKDGEEYFYGISWIEYKKLKREKSFYLGRKRSKKGKETIILI
jgi:hypothetical protein